MTDYVVFAWNDDGDYLTPIYRGRFHDLYAAVQAASQFTYAQIYNNAFSGDTGQGVGYTAWKQPENGDPLK